MPFFRKANSVTIEDNTCVEVPEEKPIAELKPASSSLTVCCAAPMGKVFEASQPHIDGAKRLVRARTESLKLKTAEHHAVAKEKLAFHYDNVKTKAAEQVAKTKQQFEEAMSKGIFRMPAEDNALDDKDASSSDADVAHLEPERKSGLSRFCRLCTLGARD